MNNNKWKTYAFWIFLAEVAGILAALLTRNSMELYTMEITQPPLAPPGILFPIVWTILYGLMGISAARIDMSEPSEERTTALMLFFVQLAVNFFWSLIFFGAQAFGLAFLWLVLLWVLIVLMIRAFFRVDPLAAWLQIPYLLWVTFAGYLSFMVWLLNG